MCLDLENGHVMELEENIGGGEVQEGWTKTTCLTSRDLEVRLVAGLRDDARKMILGRCTVVDVRIWWLEKITTTTKITAIVSN